MLTSTVRHVVEVRSSWTVTDGAVTPANTPKLLRPSAEPVRAKIRRATRDLDAAKAEIARRIAARGKR